MSELSQPPLFDFKYLKYFNMSFENSTDWNKFLEEFLIVRYINFRSNFQKENLYYIAFFANLIEGNFLMFKCDIINEAICNMKRTLSSDDISLKKMQSLTVDYLQIVNFGRIVIIQLIKNLFKNKINISNTMIQKYMSIESDLDSSEKLNIRNKIMSFEYIKSKMPKSNEKISKQNFKLNNLMIYIRL